MARYSDEERAEAVAVATAEGYPSQKGALAAASRITGIPAMTISRWFKQTSNPPPNKTVSEKKEQLADRLEKIAEKMANALEGKIKGASLKDTATSMGIAIDKMQLLRGDPTSNAKLQHQILPGVTDDEVLDILADIAEYRTPTSSAPPADTK